MLVQISSRRMSRKILITQDMEDTEAKNRRQRAEDRPRGKKLQFASKFGVQRWTFGVRRFLESSVPSVFSMVRSFSLSSVPLASYIVRA